MSLSLGELHLLPGARHKAHDLDLSQSVHSISLEMISWQKSMPMRCNGPLAGTTIRVIIVLFFSWDLRLSLQKSRDQARSSIFERLRKSNLFVMRFSEHLPNAVSKATSTPGFFKLCKFPYGLNQFDCIFSYLQQNEA